MEKVKDKKLKWDTPMLVKLGGLVGSADGIAEYDCAGGSTASGCCSGANASYVCTP